MFALICASIPNPISIIPRPQVFETKAGQFRWEALTPIFSDNDSKPVANYLREWLRQHDRRDHPHPQSATPNRIEFITNSKIIGPEAYLLRVDRHKISIAASSPAGSFYGVQSLLQLLPTEAFGTSISPRKPWLIPALFIRDSPRFGWRGTHLDVARHFMPMPFIYKLVDIMALHKLNVLHLHLTDDQGWRLEIKRYPKLTQIGSYRKDSQTNDQPDEFEGKPHSGFYTQSQLKSLVAYAKQRFVNMLPEIEMPGHSQAAIASYPELGNILPGQPNRRVNVSPGWGVHEDILNANDETIQFYKNVLDEVIQVFPFRFIHVGGDEAPKTQWKASEVAQRRIKALGLKDEDGLQSWFIRQMDSYLASKNRRLIGWDEILGGGLAPLAAVMSWRGDSGGILAAKAGHDVVMCPSSWTYLDQRQTKNPKIEMPRAWGFLSLERAYRYEPVPSSLNHTEAKHVLGAQSALWTESVATPSAAEYQLFPRLCAFSEVFWTQPQHKNYVDFQSRLPQDVERLKLMGVNVHPVESKSAPRIGGWDSTTFQTRTSTHRWEISPQVHSSGNYIAEFEYYGGDDRLVITSVALVENGRTVASDSHLGLAGAVESKTLYHLPVPHWHPGKHYEVQVTGRAQGGTDSFGDIRFFKVAL